jgi:hypothetical protein
MQKSAGSTQIAETIKSVQWNYSPSLVKSRKICHFRIADSSLAAWLITAFQTETVATYET